MTERRAVVLAGHAADVSAARAALADDDPTTRAAALGALARSGALVPDDLTAALGDPEPSVRTRAAEEAARLRHPAVAGALLAVLADDDDLVVEAAAHALGELDPPAAGSVAALAALVTGHGEVVVRETAVAALGSLASAGDGAGRDAVLRATEDVATVRRRAVLALAAFEGDDVEAALTRLAEDRDRQTRQSAEDLLHHWGTRED
jgi:HEAT repeat protein